MSTFENPIKLGDSEDLQDALVAPYPVLPDYFSILGLYLPEEKINLLASMEVSFARLNFNLTLQNRVTDFMYTDDLVLQDICNGILQLYVEAAYEVLKLQGIMLVDSLDVSLETVASVLYGSTVMGTVDIEGLCDVEELDVDNSIYLMSQILSVLTDKPIGYYTPFIQEVSISTMKKIQAMVCLSDVMEDYEVPPDEAIVKRLLDFTGKYKKEGVVLDIIRDTNYIGYDPIKYLKAVEDDIKEKIKEPNDLAFEYLCYVVASNTPDEAISKTFGEVVMESMDNPSDALAVINSSKRFFDKEVLR